MDQDDLLPAALGLAALLVVGFVAYRGATSFIRPLPIPFMAWRASLRCIHTHRTIVVVALLLAFAGAGLQAFFRAQPGLDGTVLLVASLLWQALLATSMAALVVPVHLSLIAREPNDFIITGVPRQERSWRRLLVLAAAFGFVQWLVVYCLRVGLRASVFYAPPPFKLAIGYSEWVAALLIVSFLALVRPALASGFARPVAVGVRTAVRIAPALLLTEALMLIFPFAFWVIGIQMVRALLGPSIFVLALNEVMSSAFSVFQMLAVEASTVMLLRGALLQPAPNFYRAKDADAVYARFRPY